MTSMTAVVFKGRTPRRRGDSAADPGPRRSRRSVTATSICATDVHIVKGEYPVNPGLVLGHEPVGIIDELGAGLDRYYSTGQRVITGATTPCGHCFYCLNGAHAQCGGPAAAGGSATRSTAPGRNTSWSPMRQRTSRRFRWGSPTRKSCCAPKSSRPGSPAPRTRHPDRRLGGHLRRRAGGAVRHDRREDPRGVAHHRGRCHPVRLDMARRFGANVTLNVRGGDPIAEIKRLTSGRGVDIAIEALGTPETFETALRAIRPGGTVSSLGVYPAASPPRTRRFTPASATRRS